MKDIYRQEALDHHAGARVDDGILLILPDWARWTYRLLLCLLLATAAFVAVGSVSQYAEGPAVIRANDRLAVTTTVPGIVEFVRVAPGARVARDELLVRFRAADEEAQLASVQREFDAALVRMLADPRDQEARGTLTRVRAQKDLLTARLNERFVRAPAAGTIGDLRVRAGQSVAPGELITSIAREPARFTVLALLPGQQRSALQEGQPLRLEINGYPYVYQDLTIERIDTEIVGPTEVRRLLGQELADSIAVAGPVAVVHAEISGSTFSAAGDVYRYFDGMPATARAHVRSERLITTLIPGLKRLTERSP